MPFLKDKLPFFQLSSILHNSVLTIQTYDVNVILKKHRMKVKMKLYSKVKVCMLENTLLFAEEREK